MRYLRKFFFGTSILLLGLLVFGMLGEVWGFIDLKDVDVVRILISGLTSVFCGFLILIWEEVSN